MASSAFNNEDLLKELENWVPVLVDGDVEKAVMEKFGVSGFPTVKFFSASEKPLGEMGDRSPGGIIAKLQAGAKSLGKIQLTKAYSKLKKARASLDKALAKKGNYKAALAEIAEIEKIGHQGVDFQFAMKERAKIAEIAAKELEEAKGFIESNPAKAKTALAKIKKDFEGIPASEEAGKALAELEKKEAGG